MDSLTQIALGAAVGEAVLGKKIGWRGAAWGAVFGTVPDLDILAYPFLTEVQQLAFHRGATHAIIFSFVVAPLVGPVLAKLHRKHDVPWQKWSWLAFWALLTHPILDAFTSYGTQLLWPFSTHPVAFSTLSIIDPLYTLPLLIGVIAALCLGRTSRYRSRSNWAGIGISSGYLALTILVKLYVVQVFADAFEKEGIAVQQTMVVPALLNSMLWVGMADDGESVWVGSYSIWDENTAVSLQEIDKHKELLEPYLGQTPAERMLWFSKGFYTMATDGDELIFNDMHIGRSDFWLDDDASYIFSFTLLKDPQNPAQLTGIKQRPQELTGGLNLFGRYWERIWGREE